MTSEQWLRKGTLIVSNATDGLDLSDFRFRFQTTQSDFETPNSCAIRVYNLSEATARLVQKEYTQVTLQAGYPDNFGIIFQAGIKQYRRGKENATESYLDILAGDGDEAYNHAVTNTTLAAGSTPADVVKAHIAAMKQYGVSEGHIDLSHLAGGTLPRGKVLFGMARAGLTQATRGQWSIQQGKVQVLPVQGYLPGEAVVLNSYTGMIGIPEQTQEGIKVRCLLNPRIRIGGLVQIDQKSINRLTAVGKARLSGSAYVPFNEYAVAFKADVTNDGIYRVYVAEHTGDTRDNDWYTDLVCLAVDAATNEVVAKN